MSTQAPVQGITAQTTEAVTEQPAVAAAPEPAKRDDFSEKLELLTKKERSIWRERQMMAQDKQKLAAEREEYEKWKAAKANAKKNPLEYLQQGDLSYDELTNFFLNGGKPTQESELQSVRDEIKRLRDERDQEKTQAQEQQSQAQKQAEAQALETFKEDIGAVLEEKKDQFELCHKQGEVGVDDILATVQLSYTAKLQDWHKRGRIGRPPSPMSIEDAAKIQEEFYEKEIMEFTQTKKMQSRLNPQPQADGQPQSRQPSKTLTNNMASSAASVVPAANDHDRMRRALAKLGN